MAMEQLGIRLRTELPKRQRGENIRGTGRGAWLQAATGKMSIRIRKTDQEMEVIRSGYRERAGGGERERRRSSHI
jgi:hypothetical protein